MTSRNQVHSANVPVVPVPSTSMLSSHRYLDVMTTRPSNGAAALNVRLGSQPTAGTRISSPTNDQIHTIPSTYLHAETHNLHFTGTKNHTSLLIEPVLLPNLQHVHVDTVQDLEESCLFYPDGHKNRNIRREIESSVVKHHILENNKLKSVKKKDRYRIVHKDIYADVKGPPLYYTKPRDPEMKELVKKMREKEGKILGTVQVKI